MFTRKRAIALLTIAAILAIDAIAVGFTNPPPFINNPAFTPGGTGRHVRFDLSNISGEATTLLGPTWDTDGPDGDWRCDDVYWLGAVQWFDSASAWNGHTGLFGIDNSNGTEPISGSLTFHVNNFPNPNWHKLVWDEIVFFESGGATINHGLYTGPGPNIPAPYVSRAAILNHGPLGGGDPGFIENLDGEIIPNPDWEEIKFDFFVPAGGQAYLDSFEVATLCVPEPGTWALLISAGIAFLAYIRRRNP